MVSPVTTLDLWRVPRDRVPAAFWRMARDRPRLRAAPGVRFAKLLGTGQGRRFGPGAADLTRWAALISWDGPARPNPVGPRWDRIAGGSCRLELEVLASRGSWAGEDPFGRGAGQHDRAASHDGPVVALTRARLRPGRAVRFWRAVPEVATAVTDAPGLLTTFGIGEAPLGWQGTVSVWATSRDLISFAYRDAAHQRAIARTPTENWYAEELFARFALLHVTGDASILGWAR